MRLRVMWFAFCRSFFVLLSLCLVLGNPLMGSADTRLPTDDLPWPEERTPFGATRAGNADGVPAWQGGVRASAGARSVGLAVRHAMPFAHDSRIARITAVNSASHARWLTPGLKALLQRYPDTFAIPLYPSRRTHAAPEWVGTNTVRNGQMARLQGGRVVGAAAGIPFPILRNAQGELVTDDGANADEHAALQAMWNHRLRWRGEYIVRRAAEAVVLGSGAHALVHSQQEVVFDYYRRDQVAAPSTLFRYLAFTESPARLAGGAVLIHEPIDPGKGQRLAWGYNAGQRRVIAAPNLAYDTPIPAAHGLRTADDTDMFNGATDRYHWRLLGKQTAIIPYNNDQLDDPAISYADILHRGHVNPDHTRFELHRVWVVEATLKPGKRHVYARRVFFIDEDSWQIVEADQYDARGNLMRVSLAFCRNYYDVPATWSALDVFHDLRSGRYHVQHLDNEAPAHLDFARALPDEGHFSPAALRRRSFR